MKQGGESAGEKGVYLQPVHCFRTGFDCTICPLVIERQMFRSFIIFQSWFWSVAVPAIGVVEQAAVLEQACRAPGRLLPATRGTTFYKLIISHEVFLALCNW